MRTLLRFVGWPWRLRVTTYRPPTCAPWGAAVEGPRSSAPLLALALEGAWRTAARAAGMDRQPLRNWVIRYSAEGVEGLCDRPRNFAALVKEALPATARAKPLKIWFQDIPPSPALRRARRPRSPQR